VGGLGGGEINQEIEMWAICTHVLNLATQLFMSNFKSLHIYTTYIVHNEQTKNIALEWHAAIIWLGHDYSNHLSLLLLFLSFEQFCLPVIILIILLLDKLNLL